MPWRSGTRAPPWSPSTGCGSSRASCPATPRSCTRPTGAGAGAVALRHLDRGVPALRRRRAAGHHAGQPPGAARAGGPARRRAHAAGRDGQPPGELPPRPDAHRAGRAARRQARQRGGHEVRRHRRRPSTSRTPRRTPLHRIDVARKALATAAGDGLAGLTARETQVLRLIADGATHARGLRAAVHLGEDRRQPHPAHLHQARRHQPRRRHPLGPRPRRPRSAGRRRG